MKQLFACSFLFFHFCLIAQFDHAAFDHITTEEGLSDNAVYQIKSDNKGYLWFATQDGITRFDGTNYKIFENIDEDSSSLYGEVIMDISEGLDGYLWIASNGGGLNRFNPKTETFQHYYLNDKNDFYSASCLLHDSNDQLWLGGYSIGLNSFDKETEQFQSYLMKDNLKYEPENFAKNSVLQIIEDVKDKTILWLGTNDGLFKFNKINKSFERHSLNNWTQGVSCQSIFMEKSETIWIGSWGTGLIKFNTKDGTYKSYYPNVYAFEIEKDFMQNVVFDIDKLDENQLLLSTRTMGLAIFNTKEESFSFLKNDPKNPSSLLSNEINNCYISPDNNIWISSFAKGVNRLKQENNKIYFKKLDFAKCLEKENNQITDFAIDENSQILYASSMDCKALSIFDMSEAFNFIKNVPLKGDSEGIKKLFMRSDGKLFVLNHFRSTSAEESDLLFYDPDMEEILDFNHPFINDIVQDEGFFIATDMIEDKNNVVWIGTEFQGLIKWDYKKDVFTKYLKEEEEENQNWLDSTIRISQIIASQNGNIWISTLDSAVYEFDVESESFTNYTVTLNRNHTAKLWRTTSIGEDENGNIWVGTSADGIRILDPTLGPLQKQKSYGHRNGITDEKIAKITHDSDHNMWISTSNGLFQFNDDTKQFKHYKQSNGIHDPYLIRKALKTSKNGKVLIGQSHGFHYLDINELKVDEEPPDVILNSFKIFEEEKKMDLVIDYIDKIKLNYDENFFTIGFAALNFDPSKEPSYRYQLKGIDPAWIYPSDRRQSASYTNIREGVYEFLISAKNLNGNWNNQARKLIIEIAPPWYRTIWFHLFTFIAIVLLLNLLFKYRLEQRLRIERIRLKLSSDLHDELSGLLTGIAMETDLLKMSIGDEVSKQKLSNISSGSRSAMKRMSDVIWAIDSRKDKFIHLAHRMMEHNEDSLKPLNIVCNFNIENLNNELVLPVNIRENLYYIYKEAINNIIKHAKATEVDIFMGNRAGKFILFIKDNGVGISKKNTRKGQGLSNIIMRADRIKAKVDFKTDDGYTIILRMNKIS